MRQARILVVALCLSIIFAPVSIVFLSQPTGASSYECPQNSLPLPPDAIVHATKAALKAVPTLYGGLTTAGAIVERAALATDDQRGHQVKLYCGEKVWQRTVVVYLFFPIPERETGSASLSQGVVFVSQLKGGWTVWEVAH